MEGRASLKRKKIAVWASTGECGTDDPRGKKFGEFIGAIVWFPELRARSQYTQEIAIFSRAHNQPD